MTTSKRNESLKTYTYLNSKKLQILNWYIRANFDILKDTPRESASLTAGRAVVSVGSVGSHEFWDRKLSLLGDAKIGNPQIEISNDAPGRSTWNYQ